MKILITGTNGLLGQHLLRMLKANSGYYIIACSRGQNRLRDKLGYVYEELDITDGIAVNTIINRHQPEVIVHTAAITQVDVCEQQEVLCWNTNVTATRFLLDAAEKINAHFIFLSTDFIFSGNNGPYKEDDEPSPVNYYGSSKVAAERSVMQYKATWSIVRTVLAYGTSEDASRNNIYTWIYNSLKNKTPIKVVNDQYRTPTYIKDLVKGIEQVIQRKAKGIFHISGKEEMTPYMMALKIADAFGFDRQLITEVNAATFSQPALRPPRTGFIIEKARKELGYEPRNFEEALLELKQTERSS